MQEWPPSAAALPFTRRPASCRPIRFSCGRFRRRGALAKGLLSGLAPADVAAALIILLVIRPATGLLGQLGLRASWSEKLTIAFFAIRGVGSIYYLAYGLNHMEAEGPSACGPSPGW